MKKELQTILLGLFILLIISIALIVCLQTFVFQHIEWNRTIDLLFTTLISIACAFNFAYLFILYRKNTNLIWKVFPPAMFLIISGVLFVFGRTTSISEHGIFGILLSPLIWLLIIMLLITGVSFIYFKGKNS